MDASSSRPRPALEQGRWGSQGLLARAASTTWGAAVVTHKDTHEVAASASSSGMVAGQATSSFVKTLKEESCVRVCMRCVLIRQPRTMH